MATFSGAWASGSSRREQERHGEALGAEDPLRQGRERQQREPGEDAAGELELERAAEEPAQPAPLLCRRVAEAVLRQRVLDRQVEQRLEESRGRSTVA